MFSLKGRKALITGASRGIGAAIAKTLHARGAEVVLSATQQDKLTELADFLKDRCHVLPCALDHIEAVEQLVPQAEEKMGGLDILVNNAGITRDGLMVRMKNQDFEEVLDINLRSAFLLMRGALKGMMKQRFGRILNISSVVGVTGNPGQANYCASKAGLIGLTKAAAQEVASRGITINCIAPGFIESAMTHMLTEEQKQRIIQSIPMRRMGTGEDIAASAVFLVSDEAHYITGQTLHVNGGMAMI